MDKISAALEQFESRAVHTPLLRLARSAKHARNSAQSSTVQI
jgi:hypothetical protein